MEKSRKPFAVFKFFFYLCQFILNGNENLYSMRKYLLLLLAVLFCAGLQAQTTIYVSSVVIDDSGDGSSWEHAKKYIASAITALNGNPGTVFVMAGEYNTTAELQIPTGVTVMGGFSQNSIGTDTAMRNLPGVNMHWQDDTYCTIIKGDGTFRIATVNGTLEACVVRNGFSSTMWRYISSICFG